MKVISLLKYPAMVKRHSLWSYMIVYFLGFQEALVFLIVCGKCNQAWSFPAPLSSYFQIQISRLIWKKSGPSNYLMYHQKHIYYFYKLMWVPVRLNVNSEPATRYCKDVEVSYSCIWISFNFSVMSMILSVYLGELKWQLTVALP